MSIHDDTCRIGELLADNSYAGRGIVIGKSEDGQNAVFAYFIMGRSANSRNRVFVEGVNGDVTIYPFDSSKVEDPSLIIYSPVRRFGKNIIVTNGDQTDTIYNGLKDGKAFDVSLESREFEPDSPNFTPRISGILNFDGGFSYRLSILKSADDAGSACNRYTFAYSPLGGIGHFIHTYNHDGNPLPTFTGEPKRIFIGSDIDGFTNEIWNNLDCDNKISLYCEYVDIKSGKSQTRLINKYKKEV